MPMLSPNFSLAEFTRSATAVNLGIPNNPSGTQIDNLVMLCHYVLEPLRAHFGKPVSIRSGFRCPELNKAAGGAATSQHTKGEAADIEIEGVANSEIWQYIVDHLPFDQVIAETLRKDDPAAGWVHVSYSRSQQRRDAISFLGNGRYVPGLVFA